MAKIWEYVGNKSSCSLSIITLQARYKDMENEVIVFKNGEYTYLISRSMKKGLRKYARVNN